MIALIHPRVSFVTICHRKLIENAIFISGTIVVIVNSYCRGSNFLEMMQFLSELKRGECEEVKVRVDRLQVFLSTSCIEHLDHIPDESEEPQERSVR